MHTRSETLHTGLDSDDNSNSQPEILRLDMCDTAHIPTTPKSKYNNSFSQLFRTSFDSYSKSNQWPRRLVAHVVEKLDTSQAVRTGTEPGESVTTLKHQ